MLQPVRARLLHTAAPLSPGNALSEAAAAAAAICLAAGRCHIMMMFLQTCPAAAAD
jgi:hypothetical protein